jgi:hypothetical protein
MVEATVGISGCHSAICQGTLPNMPQPEDLGRNFYDPARSSLHDMPTPQRSPKHCGDRHYSPIDKRPSCSKICRIWRTGFYIDGCATLWTVALQQAIFKQKKRFTTISLGIIYHSIALSQPPSRDTVPFKLQASSLKQIIVTVLVLEKWRSCKP